MRTRNSFLLRMWPIALLVAALSGPGHAAEKENPLADTPELSLALDAPGAVIACPQQPAYLQIADRVAQELDRRTQRRPLIVADSTPPADLGAGPVIALGNLMDSQLVRSLYLQAYDFTDHAWPSPGGHVVRTIRDPFGSGAHVLLLGGSDVSGVASAAGELVSIIKAGGPKLGYLNRVRLGCWANQIESYTSKFLATKDDIWLRSGMSGSWEYMRQIAQAGLGYLRTGNEAYLPVFNRELRWWFDHDVYHPKDDAPQMLHGFVIQLIVVWDLIRDHPLFTPEERRRIDSDFLFVFRSAAGPRRNEAASRQAVVRDNHGTRTGLDAFFGGRFFLRRFGLPEAKQWLDIADRYFRPQMTSAKPVCDDWSQQWAASLYNTLVYAMAAGKNEYLRSEPFKLAADRALIAYPNGKAPLGYMTSCAVASGDTGYLSGWPDDRTLAPQCAAMSGQGEGRGDDILRSFCTGQPVIPRQDLLGVAVAPVDRLWYQTIDATGFNPGGIFVTTAPREACFDKVAIREGWGQRDFYLLLDGISGGHHAYQDANCIVGFYEAGLPWLGTARRFYTSAGPRAQNGVSFALDGAGPGRIHRYARLLYAGRSGDYLAAAGALEGLGDVSWQRHILRHAGRWTLVIDRLIAAKPGELLAERSWHVRGKITPLPDGLVSEQTSAGRRLHLRLQSAGVPAESIIREVTGRDLNPAPSGDNLFEQGFTFHEKLRGNARTDQPLDLGALLHVGASAGESKYRLAKTETGWRIESADDAVGVIAAAGKQNGIIVSDRHGVIVIGPDSAPSQSLPGSTTQTAPAQAIEVLSTRPAAPAVTLNWRSFKVGGQRVTAVAVAADGRLAAGDAGGNVAAFLPDGNKLFQTKLDSTILSLHFVDGELLAGEDRGALTRFAPDGTRRWQNVIPYVPMAWPYWTEYASRVREITSADVNGDGRQEILISNSDRRVYAFDGQGTELWRASVEWGVFTAMTAGRFGNGFGLYGGTSRPSIHGYTIIFDATGKVRKHYSRLDIESWSIPSQFCDMRLADIDGDGQVEVITGLDTNCRQLIAYKPGGAISWDADVAGAAQAIAIRSAANTAGQAATVYCASAAGYVCAFDGKSGKRAWACFVGDPPAFVAPYGQDAVLAVSPSGDVAIIDGKGKLAGRNSLGTPASALLRPGDHRATGTILVGTEDGHLLAMPSQRP